MGCWDKFICARLDGSNYKGAKYSNSLSQKFKLMEADMHNLIPTFNWLSETENSNHKPILFGGNDGVSNVST